VGTGFTQADLGRLEELLTPIRRADSPFTGPEPKRGTVFVDPVHVADVEFRERTREGILRQPSFKGLRPDKDPADVRGVLRVDIPAAE
jgi:ATP-dependent DNA ligase